MRNGARIVVIAATLAAAGALGIMAGRTSAGGALAEQVRAVPAANPTDG